MNVRVGHCPLCGQVVYIRGETIAGHTFNVDGYPMVCLAAGRSRGEAERLASSLRKAAHP